jgi:hypothetical protein
VPSIAAQELSVPGSAIADPSATLSLLTRLTLLDVSYTDLKGAALSALPALASLEEVNLSGCQKLPSRAFRALGSLTALAKLTLDDYTYAFFLSFFRSCAFR